MFGLAAFVMLALSITIYVAVTAIISIPGAGFVLNETFLGSISLSLFSASIAFSLLVNVVDKHLEELTVRAAYREEQVDLKKAFPKTEVNDGAE